MQDLTLPCGTYSYSYSTGVSADGSTVIGNSQVQGTSRELFGTLFPGSFKLGGWSPIQKHLVKRAVERPRVIDIKGLDQQFRFAGFGQHHKIRLHLR